MEFITSIFGENGVLLCSKKKMALFFYGKQIYVKIIIYRYFLYYFTVKNTIYFI